MKHFRQLAAGLNVGPLMRALQAQPELWNEHTLRTTFAGTPHAEVDDIWLRFAPKERQGLDVVGDELECVNYPALQRLPQARPLIFDLMRYVQGERLGRVLITRLRPGRRIAPHSDVLGIYSRYYTRFHVALQGLPGSRFRANDEVVCMTTGTAWGFDASAEHEVVNDSPEDRINLLIDVRCRTCP